MNIDPKIKEGLSQILSAIPYPVNKSSLIEMARQRNLNPQITSVLDRLPDGNFSSKEELQNKLQNLVDVGQASNKQQQQR